MWPKRKKKMIISTGMATLAEVFMAVQTIRDSGNEDIVVLQCTTNYPSETQDANLLAMVSISNSCKVDVGYSDHTQTNYACYASVALGAKIVEKHFTLDNNYSKFRDHQLSLNPVSMIHLVNSIRSIEYMMGKEQKIIQPSEKKNIFSTRRSLYLSKNIKKNSKINFKDVRTVRPFAFLEPNELNKVVGKAAKIDLDINTPIIFKNLKK